MLFLYLGPKQSGLFVKSALRFKVLVINTPQLLLLRNEILIVRLLFPALNQQILKERQRTPVLLGTFVSPINVTRAL